VNSLPLFACKQFNIQHQATSELQLVFPCHVCTRGTPVLRVDC